MSKITSLFLSSILISTLIIGCGERKTIKAPAPTLAEQIQKANVPGFNGDSAYQFVARQVAFGPRVPNTTAHTACAFYLAATLKRFTPDVVVQEAKVRAYNGTTLAIKNIIGTFNPEAQGRLLLCAHWDSRPYADHDPDPSNHFKPIPGANDGASGVGVLLEVARQLSIQQPSIGVDIVLFDAEDFGEHQSIQGGQEDTWALGSQHWARNPHTRGYKARFGILLDMVGASDAVFTMEGTSMYHAPDIMKKVWDIAHAIGYEKYFIRKQTNPIIDDHTYVNEIIRIPTINIIHYEAGSASGFFKHWHTLRDDMSNIDPNTLNAVGCTVLTVLYLEK